MGDSISEKLDTIFTVSKPAKENAGEDCFCCSVKQNAALVAVFDGCGGLGSQTYAKAGGKTGAYMASRIACGGLYDWFNDKGEQSFASSSEMAASMKEYLRRAYEVSAPYLKSDSLILGSMVRSIPTTMAAAVVRKNTASEMELDLFWAGDSRVYLIDGQGLAQLTVDDLDDVDAFTNLTSDAVLTNVLAQDGKYEIHNKHMIIRRPTMIFAATDGCFNYVSSPMTFEHMILSSIVKSSSVLQMKEILKENMAEVAGDDLAFSFLSIGYSSFDNIRQQAKTLKSQLEREYIQYIPEEYNANILQNMWNQYKSKYLRYIEE